MAGHIGDMVSQEWNTPEHLVKAVREVVGTIGLDPCDNEHSCTDASHSYRLPERDGLLLPWIDYGPVYCNPPYGRTILSPENAIVDPKFFKTLPKDVQKTYKVTTIADWVERAYTAYLLGTPVLLLIPAATETTFWFKYIWHSATAICFIKGRVSHPLNGANVAASTKPSAMVYFGDNVTAFQSAFGPLGKVVLL